MAPVLKPKRFNTSEDKSSFLRFDRGHSFLVFVKDIQLSNINDLLALLTDEVEKTRDDNNKDLSPILLKNIENTLYLIHKGEVSVDDFKERAFVDFLVDVAENDFSTDEVKNFLDGLK